MSYCVKKTGALTILDELNPAARAAAAPLAGDGPVAMINPLWFRDQVADPAGFDGAEPDPRSAYYEGCSGTFMDVVRRFGSAGVEVIHGGSRTQTSTKASNDE